MNRPDILSINKTKSTAFSEDNGCKPEGKRRAFLNATLTQLVEHPDVNREGRWFRFAVVAGIEILVCHFSSAGRATDL